MLHVLFTPDGIPGWIGDQPREGSEPIETMDIEFLASHRRLPDGVWVPRDSESGPTPEEIAAAEAIRAAQEAQAEAEAHAEALERIEHEIARQAAPDALLRSMGKITIAELTARVAVIRARVEAGERD